ncbi:MAG: hypothetical protein B1H13_08540 [Desulfobacteraceae bacterium 4484_190.3]|nr:MAG: hypothetical protein B1H13_08540 [Desulfobacteraceae bacterium 4484_190.3]
MLITSKIRPAYSNFLMQSAVPITDLGKAFNETRLSLNALDNKIKEFTKWRDDIDKSLSRPGIRLI